MDCQKASRDKVDNFGNIVAFLPLIYLVFMYVWHGISHYDDSLNLIGPAWVMEMGGEDTPFIMEYACEIGGILAILAGLICRKRWVVVKGLWTCGAGLVLTGWYMWMTF